MEEEKKKLNSPMARRDFLRKCGTWITGGSLLALGNVLAIKSSAKNGEMMWQIDHEKCLQCGRCQTECVLSVSAVKCFHANLRCGYIL